MKDVLRLIMSLSFIYIVFFLFALGDGITEANMTYHNKCKIPKTRIEYIFPAFRFGCWLGSVPE